MRDRWRQSAVIAGELGLHRHSDSRHDSSCEERESSLGRMLHVSSTRCHHFLDFLVENGSGGCDGKGRAFPACVRIDHPERAYDEYGSGHTGAQREASPGERTGDCCLFHAPAEVVRYTDQETEKDM